MTLATRFTVGGLSCIALEGGIQKLDGGAMFGVVPKPLWARRIAPDDRNRIPLAMRCILVEHPSGPVLIDTALGNKEDAKFQEIYGIENAGRGGAGGGPTQLEDALAEAGYRPGDIRWVMNTHLHFDHAGGNTVRREDGTVDLAFPNATYVVRREELEFARHPNERTRASYLPHNFEPIARAGRWHLTAGDGPVLPGIETRATPGHVPYHQSIVLRDGGEVAVFLGDLIPTAHHLPLPYIMGYDLEPLRTLESKRALLAEALAGRWRLLFEHDAHTVMGWVVADEGKGGGGVRLEGTVPAPAVDSRPVPR